MKRLALLALIWGWSFLFIKVAVGGMTPTTVAAARIALGALVLNGFLLSRGQRLPSDRTLWRHFATTALFASALPFSLLAWGEERITSALASVLNASTPLFTALAVAALLSERLRGPQVAGLLVGLSGVAVAAGVGGSDLAASSLTGGAAAVGAGVCYGIGFAYMKRHLMGVPPVVAAAGQLTAGAVILTPVALATTAAEGIDPAPHRLLAVALLGVVGTGIAYVLNYRTVAEIGPTRASLVTYLVPVVAVAVGVVVLGEPFRFRLLVGGAMIVAGISLVNRRIRLPAGWRRTPVAPGPGVGVVVLLALAVALVGCADGDEGGPPGGLAGTGPNAEESGCGPVVREDLDPSSSVHLLPGAPEPDYLTEPPTSGPHRSGRPPTGVVDEPLERPVQVLLLETGGVLIQHDDLDEEEVARLEVLAADQVVVAPNPDLPAPVIATAWRTKRACGSVDLEALRAFVDEHLGVGPGHEDG